MAGEDPRALMAEIQDLSRSIGRLVRRRDSGLLWWNFDALELKRLQEQRSRLQAQLPPMRLAASR